MTSQPGDPGAQPDLPRDRANQDSPAAEPAGATTAGAAGTDTIPVIAMPPDEVNRRDRTASGGKWRRPFSRRSRGARHPVPGAGGTPPGQAIPGNATAASLPTGPTRAATHGLRSTGQRAGPQPDPGGGSAHSGGTVPPAGGTPRGGAPRIPPGAGRQRRLSARATGDRAVATLEAASSRRAVAAAAADLLWTRPPEKPTRYRLPARLTDMGHGWLDGRRGLPRLPEITAPDPGGESAPAAGEAAVTPPLAHVAQTVADAPSRPAVEGFPPARVPATPPAWLQTPRMLVLWRQGLERIRAEEEACIRDCSAYQRELSRFQKARDTATEKHEQALAELARTQCPLTVPELSVRRLAEQSTRDRPDSLVRNRRQTGWERRLARAEQTANTATAQLADATREAELRQELRRDRIALAQAAALRHYEFCMRRTATYLQQLVRTHKQGEDLNMLLMRYPAGPELPEWTRNPPTRDETSSQ